MKTPPPPPPEEEVFGQQASAVPGIFRHILAPQEAADPRELLFSEGLGSTITPAGQMLSALEGVARGGRKAQEGYGMAGDLVSPEAGAIARKVSGLVLPTSKMGVAALAAGEALGADKAAQAAKMAPSTKATQAGAGVLKVLNATPEKYGEAALRKPSILREAKMPAEMAKAYEDFETQHGLKGLQAVEQDALVDRAPAELKEVMLETARRVKSGAAVPKQDLYYASQIGRKLKDAAASGDPDSIRFLRGKTYGVAKDMVDQALEKQAPGYADLRLANFESKVREAFSHALPQNKNMSPNVLRPWMAVGKPLATAAAGEYVGEKTGHPVLGAALGAAAISPAAAGMAIRAASSPITAGAATLGVKSAMDAMRDDSKQAINLIMAQGGLNPKKSGAAGRALEGLPRSWANPSGKLSLDDLTRIWHEKGIIAEEDPQLTLSKLKALSEKR